MTSLQLDGAHGPVAWARSPTTVSEPLSDRRATIFNCIGDRSWTSSTTMWPYVRISSASSIRPFRVGTGPSTSRASSSRATSDAVQRTSSTSSDRGRYRAATSASSKSVAGGEAQQRPRPEQVVEQLRRREHRPHPLEGGAHLGHAAQLLAQLRRRHVDRHATRRPGRRRTRPRRNAVRCCGGGTGGRAALTMRADSSTVRRR